METKETAKQKWTDNDTEAMFATIGKYLVVFQWMEGILDQILLLGWGWENWGASQVKIAGMTNEKKIKAVRKLVMSAREFARVHTRPDWLEHFQSVLKRFDEERQQRNTLVHSQYLFEAVDAGIPPLISKRTKSEGKATFDQRHFSKEFQTHLFENVGKLSMDLNFVLVQLRHDYAAHELSSAGE
ncbi:MAG: hypothetical protein E5W90_12985 [Mesorhizobium sp.]|nr:MAG: hypothetical protein E5W90_12985 [Mesorhizobium sp.]